MTSPRRARVIVCHSGLRISPALSAGLIVGALIGLIGCQRDATSAGPTSKAAPATGPARTEQRRASLPAAAQGASPTERAWWNQPPLIDALSLTPDQRAKMDVLLQQAVETQRAAQERQRDQQRKLKEALEAGRWDAAREAAAAAADGITTSWRTQTNLKIDVLACLDPTQQRLVMEQHRYLLRQTSVLGRLRGTTRQRPTAPTGQP